MAIKINVRGMSALKPNMPRTHTLDRAEPQTPRLGFSRGGDLQRISKPIIIN